MLFNVFFFEVSLELQVFSDTNYIIETLEYILYILSLNLK